jgi:mRNA-degrading endonuclease RelE of RelBE toxin-antitoxin system
VTDKTEKLLAKMTAEQREAIISTIERLVTGNERGLDIKALKGHQNLYRARVGNYRIIYGRVNGEYIQYAITKRDDQTYRDF